MSTARAYFVITNRGQLGPFDRIGLRQALQSGEIAGDDQVRSALGSPKGTVTQVLRRNSDRVRHASSGELEAQPASGGSFRGPVPLIIIGLLCVVVLLLVLRQSPEPIQVVIAPPQPAPEAAPPEAAPKPKAVPAVKPAEPPVPPPAPPQVQETKPPPMLVDLLAGRQVGDWWIGGGAQVRPGGKGYAWDIGMPASDSWACIQLADDVRNLDRGTGLVLTFAPGGVPGRLQVELIEPSGERFLAPCAMPTEGPRYVLVPWSTFYRREWQPDGATNDGMQRANIQNLSLLHDEQTTAIVRLVTIGVY